MTTLEKKCAGCGGTGDPHRGLTMVDDAANRPLVYLCRAGHGSAYTETPKTACLGKYLLKREVTCVVCGTDEMMNYYPARRIRPVCKSCEAKLSALSKREESRRWYALDNYELLGNAIPSGVHADYDALGRALLKAFGAPHRRVDNFVWLTTKPEWRHDRYANGTVELTDEQAEGLRDFFTAFAECIKKVAEAKHSEGAALLVRLARGEVSIDEYNDGRKPVK